MNSRYKWQPPTDICQYGRALFFNAIKLLFFVAVASMFLTIIGNFIYVAVFKCPFTAGCSTLKWSVLQKILVSLGSGIIGVSALVATIVGFGVICIYSFEFLEHQYKESSYFKNKKDKPVKESSIKKAYLAWKGKHCYKIKFNHYPD
jgi:hypothetical protein